MPKFSIAKRCPMRAELLRERLRLRQILRRVLLADLEAELPRRDAASCRRPSPSQSSSVLSISDSQEA